MRTCGVCGASAETVRFYPNIRGYCAECWKAEMRLNRMVKRDQYALAQRQRSTVRKVSSAVVVMARTLAAVRCFVPGAGDLSKQLDKL